MHIHINQDDNFKFGMILEKILNKFNLLNVNNKLKPELIYVFKITNTKRIKTWKIPVNTLIIGVLMIMRTISKHISILEVVKPSLYSELF
jgi:hypothetical protein